MTAILATAAVAANASITYSNISGSVLFGDSTTDTLQVYTKGPENEIVSVTSTRYPLLVVNPGYRQTATINLSYDASSTTAIESLTQHLFGQVRGDGSVRFIGTVTDLDSFDILASFDVTQTAGATSAFLRIDEIDFSRPSDNYRFSATFELNAPTAGSVAGLGIIEHNANPVPEPASMAALGLGLAGIAARRRRK